MSSTIVLQKITLFPNTPGVYLMKSAEGTVIYVGKASSLKKRVASYFTKSHDIKTEKLVQQIHRIDYILTDSILEATFKEAALIKKYQPRYNIEQKDDKSFAYLLITRDAFPKVHIKREKELPSIPLSKIKALFGPFMSANVLRSSLNLIRKSIPWTNCVPPRSGKPSPCFYYHLNQCPGICMSEIGNREYQKIIRKLILFIRGKKRTVIYELKKEMAALSKARNYEKAAIVRNQIFHLEHINDAILLQKEKEGHEREFSRIEGYDISNINGKYATGSMVVFERDEPNKNEYRRFRIKTVLGANDVAMLQEILRRRFKNPWPHPDLILIDGGIPQVHACQAVLMELKLAIPVVGIAKGPRRKNARLIFCHVPVSLQRDISAIKNTLIRLQDEAHRFALQYHKHLRSRLY